MDQTRAREIARDAAKQASDNASEAAKRVGEQVQPVLDKGKSMAQDLADQASEVGRQALDGRASLSKTSLRKQNKWRAISMTRALAQDSTSANMPRKNL